MNLQDHFLYELVRDINEADDLQAAIDLFLERVTGRGGWDHGELWLCDGSTLRPALLTSETPSPGGPEDSAQERPRSRHRSVRVDSSDGPLGQALQSREPIWRQGIASSEGEPLTELAACAGFRTAVAIPVLPRGQVVGVLALFEKRDRPLDSEELELLRVVAAPLGSLILRRRAEAALRESELRFRQVAEHLPGALLIVSRRIDRLIYANPRAEEVWGVSVEDLRNDPRCFLENVSVQHKRKVTEAWEDPREPREIEFDLRRTDGVRTLRTTVFPIRDPAGNVVRIAAISTDLTERRAMHRKLAVQSGLVRMGEMTTVIAHDLKSPLASIITGLEFVARKVRPGSTERAICEQLRARVRTLHQTAEDMLLLSQPQVPERTPVNILGLLERAVEVFRESEEHERVEVEITGGADVTFALDERRMIQVLLNLLVNASQAMRGVGRVRVRVTVDGAWCRTEISDGGPGIPPETREKVFEPFFTTKETGTGLGLALAKQLVEAHGGTIWIDCPESGGTAVTLELPLR